MQSSGFTLQLYALDKHSKSLPTLLEVTESPFNEFMTSISDLFSTKLKTISTQGDDVIYNNKAVTFAAGLIFRILVKVDINLLELIKKKLNESQQIFSTQAFEYTKYLFDTLLTQAVYSLDKSEPLLYLNQILRYKNIQLIDSGQNSVLSYLYSLIHTCQCADCLDQFKSNQQFSVFDDKTQVIQPQSKFVILLMDQNTPALVFLPKDEVQYQKKIIRNHKRFLYHTLSLILIESSLGQQAQQRWFTQTISTQPFKGSETEFFNALLSIFPSGQEIQKDLNKNTSLMSYIRKYFVFQNQTYEMVKNQLRNNVAPPQVLIINNVSDDPFKTVVVQPKPKITAPERRDTKIFMG